MLNIGRNCLIYQQAQVDAAGHGTLFACFFTGDLLSLMQLSGCERQRQSGDFAKTVAQARTGVVASS